MNQFVVKTEEQAPLDELMLAMDVVDTLRHRELVLARELGADDRDHALFERLREIYTSQGIEVTDEVLAQGVRALREDRFVYAGPSPSFGRSLATLYVTRSRWGKWVGSLGVLLVVGALAFQLFVRGPELRALEELPADLQGAYQGIVVATQDPGVLGDARAFLVAGEAAVAEHDFRAARESIGELRTLGNRLQQTYELRVVSRPNEESGFWRESAESRGARNYYLVVEAIAPDGNALTVPIRNEEDSRTRRVSRWGIRVDQATYDRFVADKRDDGIIQRAVVGAKRRGELEPSYSIATTGAITNW